MTEFESHARGGPVAGNQASAGNEVDRGDGNGPPGVGSGAGNAGAGNGDGQPRRGGRRRAAVGEDSVENGQAIEATLEEGPGPSRAESIALGAEGGFVGQGYHRTYRAYRAAVEQALEGAAVPDGRQQLVRRYFELIRPRER